MPANWSSRFSIAEQHGGRVAQDSSVFRSPGRWLVTYGNSAAYTRFQAQQVEPLGDHARGHRREPVDDLLDLGRQRAFIAEAAGGRARDVGEPEQVGALHLVEHQRARHRVQHLDARVDRAALLQPGVPGDAHAGELRDLLAAQAGVRRRWPGGRPTSSGRTRSRRDRRNAASSVRRALLNSVLLAPVLLTAVPLMGSLPLRPPRRPSAARTPVFSRCGGPARWCQYQDNQALGTSIRRAADSMS